MRLSLALLPLLLLTITAGCGSERILNSVPRELVGKAQISGMPYVRTWGDGVEEHFINSLANAMVQERAYYAAQNIELPKELHILAISGGADEGAYGAGLICGWTERGDRPSFKIVTGISTGALIAPLVFIGPDADDVLREGYTEVTVADIASFRGILAAIQTDGLADTEPLAKLLQKWITTETLKAVAREHAKGRRLLVGTVNLEAQRPVVWDMGAIASSGHPKAIDLFRKVMLASASVPGAFEPQYITVNAGGKKYEELHVDGGTVTQVFLWGAGVDVKEIARRAGVAQPQRRRKIHLYVLRNGRLFPEHKKMRATFSSIAERAVSTLIKTQGIGDILRVYNTAKQNDMLFYLSSIPADFTVKYPGIFDKEYMNALFEFGRKRMLEGEPWQSSPPYLIRSDHRKPIEPPATTNPVDLK